MQFRPARPELFEIKFMSPQPYDDFYTAYAVIPGLVVFPRFRGQPVRSHTRGKRSLAAAALLVICLGDPYLCAGRSGYAEYVTLEADHDAGYGPGDKMKFNMSTAPGDHTLATFDVMVTISSAAGV